MSDSTKPDDDEPFDEAIEVSSDPANMTRDDLFAELDAWDQSFDALHEAPPFEDDQSKATSSGSPALDVNLDKIAALAPMFGAEPVVSPLSSAASSPEAIAAQKRQSASLPVALPDGGFGDASTRMIDRRDALAASTQPVPGSDKPPPAADAVPKRRSGPAIVRRDALERKRENPGWSTPPTGVAPVADFSESATRIASLSEIDASANAVGAEVTAERRAFDPTGLDRVAAANEIASSTFVDDDDDYADIEIGNEAVTAIAPSIDVAPPKRTTTAHVVRRAPGPSAIMSAVTLPRAMSPEPLVEAPTDVPTVVAAAVTAPTTDPELDFGSTPDIVPAPAAATASRAESPALEATASNIQVLEVRVRVPTNVPPMSPRQRAESVASAQFNSPTNTGAVAWAITDNNSSSRTGARRATSTPFGAVRPASDPVAVEPAMERRRIIASEPTLDLEAISFVNDAPELPPSEFDPGAEDRLGVYERELETIDEPADICALRIEAGRLAELLGRQQDAIRHYELALLADPRSTTAMRSLRRVASRAGDISEATRLLESEYNVASGSERHALGLARVDLLMASGDHDLARVAVGDLLDAAPADIRGLLAQLELAFLDGRAAELGETLERVSQAVSDSRVQSWAQFARGQWAEHAAQLPAARQAYRRASELDARNVNALWGLARVASASGDRSAYGQSLLAVAEAIAADDPQLAAAYALRAVMYLPVDARASAAARAAELLPNDALTVSTRVEADPEHRDASALVETLGSFAAHARRPGQRAHAALLAAELRAQSNAASDAQQIVDGWQAALAHVDDDYVAGTLRTALVANGDVAGVAALDHAQRENSPTSERSALTAARGAAPGDAQSLLAAANASHPASIAILETRSDQLSLDARAELWQRVASARSDELDFTYVAMRSANAWRDVADDAGDDTARRQHALIAGYDAWRELAEQSSDASILTMARAMALTSARRLGDWARTRTALSAVAAAESDPTRRLGLALELAQLDVAHSGDDDAQRIATLSASDESVRAAAEAAPGDPRVTGWSALLARAHRQPSELATVLDVQADYAERQGKIREATALRYRAAAIWLDDEAHEAQGNASIAALLERDPDLHIAKALRLRHDGDAATSGASATDFAALVRNGEAQADAGDVGAAALSFAKALALRPGNPMANAPLIRLAFDGAAHPEPAAVVARTQLQAAETANDGAAKADAYEALSRIDADLRKDPASARLALASAIAADPTRVSVLRQLEFDAAREERWSDLAQLRERIALAIEQTATADISALLFDRATLLGREHATDDEMTAAYARVVAIEPSPRMALFHLEALVRSQGSSQQLAELETAISQRYLTDDAARAAFLTRAGETYADVGQLDDALARFRAAAAVAPGYVPALLGWRTAAIKSQLWPEVAEAAIKQAEVTADDSARATLFHLAGVTLMDKARDHERAIVTLQRACTANPDHRDAFVRLRLLLHEAARHEDIAALLDQRLDREVDPTIKLQLHRALADLCRNAFDDRDRALVHYRAIAAADPQDRRAIAAIADIVWEVGDWATAASALAARLELETDPMVLRGLHFRVGVLNEEHLNDNDAAITAWGRALALDADDKATLIRVAELAHRVGNWQLALDSYERLLGLEIDPTLRVDYFHRVAQIHLVGLGDRKRAERTLAMALEAVPESATALTEFAKFYLAVGDQASVRVQANRVAGAMRARISKDPTDATAYRVLARAMIVRASSGVAGSGAIARNAATIARRLDEPTTSQVADATGDDELDRAIALLAADGTAEVFAAARRDNSDGGEDDGLFPRTVPQELRQLFRLLGDRVGKHVGVDLRAHGVTKADRIRPKERTAAIVEEVSKWLGMGEVEVYVSSKDPWLAIAEPVGPWAVVLGSELVARGPSAIRFGAAAALTMASTSLAVPDRLAPDDVSALVVALLRLFQPEFNALAVDADAVIAHLNRLRRLIPTTLANELRPFALAVDAAHFDPTAVATGLDQVAVRAGLLATGDVGIGLTVLQARLRSPEVRNAVGISEVRDYLEFAVSDDYAALRG